MKNLRNRRDGTNPFHKVSTILYAVMMALVIAGCTKERDADFPEGVSETVFDLQMIRGAEFKVLLGGQAVVIDRRSELRAGGEAAPAEVIKYEGLTPLAPMFDNLSIIGTPGAAYRVRFRVDKEYLTAYKVVSDPEELTIMERQVAKEYEEFPNLHAVPIFTYPVENYGRVVKAKNDLGEETDTLRLQETEWELATHIKASLFASRRTDVKPPANNSETADRVFVADKVDGLVLSGKDMKDLIDIQIGSGDNSGSAATSMFLMQLSGKDLNILEVTTIDSETVTDEMRELLDTDKCADGKCPIAHCDAATLQQLPADFDKDSCVTVVRFSARVKYVVAVQPEVGEGIVSPEVEFREPTDPNERSLVQIDKNPALEEKNPVDQIAFLNPSRALFTKDLRNQEFLFRRTMEDSPNGFDFTFAGASGNLEIVKFNFLADRMQVQRADALIDAGTGSNVDVETLISVPARYVRQELTDVNGNPLQVPRFVPTSHQDPDAVAIVDWTQNAIPNISSPLNYYSLERCFTGAREKLISEVDQRLKEGYLNFSLATTYSSSPTIDCAGIGRAGYFDVVQTTFTFKERFSFKRYIKTAEEKPLLNVPYEAQKRLGFGLFTYSKNVPDDLGNIGDDGTVIPLPAIFDLKEGKQITYVLAGAPEKEPQRSAVIKATQEVIDDWNIAFRRAFKDTPMEREKDVLVLKIEGENIEPRKLGDLDRNYIYYVQKRTKSRVIGLGGSHSNPRTGEVEAASVFLYGGNILGVVDSIRKIDAAKKKYEEQVLASIRAAEAAMDQAEAEAGNNAGGAEGANAGGGENSDAVAGGGDGSGGVHESNGGIVLPPQADLANDLLAMAKDYNLQPLSDMQLVRKGALQKLSSVQKQDISFYANLIQDLRSDLTQARKDAVDAMSRNVHAKAIYEAYRRSVNDGKLQDRDAVAAHFNHALLESAGNQLTEEEKRRIRGTANRHEAMSKVLGSMRGGHICAYEADDALVLSAAEDAGEKSDLEIMISIYKPTLAHEIGHNLGLRHNFIASFDGAHHKFDGEEKTKRNYSSVMDYMPDDHETYSGLGPQDVAAIRAAYAQLVEVHPDIVSQLPPQLGDIPVVAGKYLPIEGYRQLLGLDSWLHLNSQAMSRLPLRPYQFCSDEDAGHYPTCNRFDTGASATAIVDNVINDHRALYSIRNFPGDRLNFGFSGQGSYIGRLFSKLIPVRQFLEETIYQLITGGDGETINSHAVATINTMFFLHEIVRSPDAPGNLAEEGRFVAVPHQESGQQIVVERKALNDLAFDLNSDRLRVRGVEFDKVIALLMLTERSLGFPRYERISLRFSFPEFEQLVFANQVQSPLQLPTIGLLTEIMENRVSPTAPGPRGASIPLDGKFKVSTTDTMRFFAVMGAIANLDVDGLEAKDNVSSLFRVMSNFSAPEGAPVLMRPGVGQDNLSELRYWSFDGALAVDQIIGKGQMFGQVNAVKEEIAPLMAAWVKLKFAPAEEEAPADGGEGPAPGEGDVADAPGNGNGNGPGNGNGNGNGNGAGEEESELAKAEKALAEALAKLPDTAGPKELAAIEGFLGQVINLANLIGQFGDAVMPVDQFQNLLQNLAKDAPSLGLAMAAIPAEELGLQVLNGVVNPRDLDIEELTIFRNTQTLNTLFYNLHPEFRR